LLNIRKTVFRSITTSTLNLLFVKAYIPHIVTVHPVWPRSYKNGVIRVFFVSRLKLVRGDQTWLYFLVFISCCSIIFVILMNGCCCAGFSSSRYQPKGWLGKVSLKWPRPTLFSVESDVKSLLNSTVSVHESAANSQFIAEWIADSRSDAVWVVCEHGTAGAASLLAVGYLNKHRSMFSRLRAASHTHTHTQTENRSPTQRPSAYMSTQWSGRLIFAFPRARGRHFEWLTDYYYWKDSDTVTVTTNAVQDKRNIYMYICLHVGSPLCQPSKDTFSRKIIWSNLIILGSNIEQNKNAPN